MKTALLCGLLAIATVTACSHDCTGNLVDVGRQCPATFAGELEALTCSPYLMLQVFRCGDLVVFRSGGGYGGLTCSYDATSHALVGAELSSDVNTLCGDSFTESAGRNAALACFEAGPATEKTCPPPDGGAE